MVSMALLQTTMQHAGAVEDHAAVEAVDVAGDGAARRPCAVGQT